MRYGSIAGIIIIVIMVMIVGLVFDITLKKHNVTPEQQSFPSEITMQSGDIEKIKADSYTRGFIDGRASRLEEESGRAMCRIGIQEGVTPSPYPEWRKYADAISTIPNGTVMCP